MKARKVKSTLRCKAKKFAACMMATLMVVSAMNVGGWGMIEVKAEETGESTETTVAGNMPQLLSIIDGSERATIISDGKLQDDNVFDNADTIYQGTNWYYDSTKNHLVLENVSISGKMESLNGDLSIMLSGINVVKQYISSELTVSDEHTLEIDGNNYNGSLVCERISVTSAGTDKGPNNINITGATVETSQIDCSGSLTIENSHIVVNNNDHSAAISGKDISITDSYVEAKTINTYGYDKAIKSEQKISVSGSQIVAESVVDSEQAVLSDCDFSNSVITKKWRDADTGEEVTKTYVYGTATLKEDLTIASGESIDFVNGANITNLDKLTVEDGATILVDGVEHKHNTDVDFTYTWNDNTHTKAKFCPDCPIAYAAEAATDSHHYNAQGFCTVCDAYQSAALTTDKYDINEDGSKDSVYEVSNAGQLYWFAGLVNGTLPEVQQDRFANAVLTNDIIVNENVLVDGEVAGDTSGFRNWTPIAGKLKINGIVYGYGGIFDGQNYSISGIYCNLSDMDVANGGFFGYNESDSIVRNLSMKDSYITIMKKSYRINAAGIVGQNYGRIQSCSFDGLVNGSDKVGGICTSNNGMIINCYNSGRIATDELVSGECGGICALNYGTIETCYNTGIITAGDGDGGGICGYNGACIKDCYNRGNVTVLNESNSVGGICGHNGSGSITNSYNTGIITGNENVGQIYGYLDDGTITSCYYLSDNETAENGGMTGKTAEQFASGEVAYLLQEKHSDEDEVWGQNIGTDAYPVLGGNKVYANKKYSGHDEKEEAVIGIVYSNEDKAEFSHTLVKTDWVDAGCTTNGEEEYWTCSECGKMFSDENAENEITNAPVLAPLGHDYGLSVETSEEGTKSSLVFTCKRKGCTENESGHQEKITITAPGDAVLTYDGNSKEALVSQTFAEEIRALPKVSYSGSNLVDGKPVKTGNYTASITAGEGSDKVTATVKYTIAQAQLTVTKATAENRIYDGTSKVNVTGVALAGIIGNDIVSVDTTGLQGTLKSTNAGSYKEITLPQLTLTGSDAANYKLVQPDSAVALTGDVVISKAAVAPNMPGDTISTAYSKTKVKDITLAEDWSWKESDLEKELAVGVAVTATAEYNGTDKGNYETESVDIAITRSACEHKAGEILYTGEGEKAPTCTEDGLGHRECTICHEVIESGIKVAAAHSFSSEWTIDKPATTTEEGSKSHHCTKCDARTDITAIPKLSSGGSSSGGGSSAGGGTSSGTTDPKQDEEKPTDDSNKPTDDNNKPSENKPEAVGTKLTKSGITYKVSSVKGKTPTVTYTKASKNAKGTVTIPKTVMIDGVKYQVTAIADKAFAGNKNVTKIVIQDQITTIGTKAFSNCSNLKVIVIKSTKLTSKNIDAKAFAGIAKDVVIQVPEKKLAAYKKLFAKKGLNKKVKLKAIKSK